VSLEVRSSPHTQGGDLTLRPRFWFRCVRGARISVLRGRVKHWISPTRMCGSRRQADHIRITQMGGGLDVSGEDGASSRNLTVAIYRWPC
jgi:hypothetical protein